MHPKSYKARTIKASVGISNVLSQKMDEESGTATALINLAEAIQQLNKSHPEVDMTMEMSNELSDTYYIEVSMVDFDEDVVASLEEEVIEAIESDFDYHKSEKTDSNYLILFKDKL